MIAALTITVGWWLVPAIITLVTLVLAVCFAVSESRDSGFFEVWPLVLFLALLISGCAWGLFFAVRYFQISGGAS